MQWSLLRLLYILVRIRSPPFFLSPQSSEVYLDVEEGGEMETILVFYIRVNRMLTLKGQA